MVFTVLYIVKFNHFYKLSKGEIIFCILLLLTWVNSSDERAQAISYLNKATTNTFTPNGDGENEMFKPKGDGIIKFEMMIFDRWIYLRIPSKNVANSSLTMVQPLTLSDKL